MFQQYADTLVLNKLGQILLLQRSNDDDFMPSKWSLPGGKVEQFDNSFFEAASRELAEETALIVEYDKKSLKLQSYQNENGSVTNYMVCYLNSNYPLIVLDINEHQKYEWVNISDLDKYDLMFDLGQRIKDVLSDYYNQEYRQVFVKSRINQISIEDAFNSDLISSTDYLTLRGSNVKPFLYNGFLISSNSIEKSNGSKSLKKYVLENSNISVGYFVNNQ